MKFARIGYAILLVIVIWWVSLFTQKIAFVALYALLLMPLVSFVCALVCRARVQATQSLSRVSLMKGETLMLHVDIKNPDLIPYPYIALRLPASLAVEELAGVRSRAALCSVRARNTARVSLTVPCRYRGEYPVGISEVWVYDFLGLLRLKKKIAAPVRVTVYPRVLSMEELPIQPGVFPSDNTKVALSGGDPTEVLYVDSYQPSDNIRQIHWKLSSKRDDLMVKRYAAEAERGLMIVADLGKKKYKPDTARAVEDSIIECALAVSNFCIRHKITAGVSYFSKGAVTLACRDQGDFSALYTAFALIACESEEPVASLLNRPGQEHTTGLSLVLVTDRLDHDLADRLLRQYGSLYQHILLYYVRADYALTEKQKSAATQIVRMLTHKGIDCLAVSVTDPDFEKQDARGKKQTRGKIRQKPRKPTH